MKTHTMQPNTTQVPHHIIREWMPRLKDVELRVLLIITDQTLGWIADEKTGRRKERDWISRHQLETKTGRTRFHVSKAVSALTEYGLIDALAEDGSPLDTSKKRQLSGGKIYYRLKTKEATLFDKVPGSKGATLEGGVAQIVPGTKRATTKETVITKEGLRPSAGDNLIPEVIDLFKEINPTGYRLWFANKNQRKACEQLLETHGFDKVRRVIENLPKTNATPYYPTITTPYQLAIDWPKLEAAYLRTKQKNATKGRGFVV